MKLLDLYKEMSKIEVNDKGEKKFVLEEYTSSAGNKPGSMFFFLTTNRRTLYGKGKTEPSGFAASFKKILNVVGEPRKYWQKKTKANQEPEKQHTVVMRKSEFFRVRDDAYVLTARGVVFGNLVANETLSTVDKWVITYLMILTGYYNNEPLYIQERVKYLFEKWEEYGYTNEEVLVIIEEFIHASSDPAYRRRSEKAKYDYLYLDSFFINLEEFNFLKEYKKASEAEKNELKEYVANNIDNSKTKNDKFCLISYKYRSGGAQTGTTLRDNAIILYLTYFLNNLLDNDFDMFIKTILDCYEKFFDYNREAVENFIYKESRNKNVFKNIYEKAMEIEEPVVSKIENISVEDIYRILDNLDTTDQEGKQKIEQASAELKSYAKANSDHKCVLEDLENCKYFTSKTDNENYLEVHHFIPREFSNDFDNSIEVLENYIALCPNCHAKIHRAADKERKKLIDYIYKERKSDLKNRGLAVSEKTLYEYYKIDD